jgi:hypothetical protein
MDLSTFGTALAQLIPSIPLFIIWIAGIVLAINLRRRDGRVAVFAASGLMLFIAQSLCGAIANTSIQFLMRDANVTASNIGLMFSVLSVVNACIAGGAWVLILLAIFTGRQ